MTATGIDHVILTRFNLPSKGRESLIRAQDGWLRDRVELFEKYCLPSIQRQDTDNFKWIVYFDPESPQWLRDWITLQEQDAGFLPIFRESVSTSDLVHDMREVTGGRGKILITTNLDNDDAVAVDFVSQIQNAVQGRARQVIYLANGLILHEPKLYVHRDTDNAFCSVAESWEEPKTAWTDWHTRLHLHMQVNLVDGPPAWLQVIHGTNVSNRVHGRLTPPRVHQDRFGPLIKALPEPSAFRFAAENMVVRPCRSAAWLTRSSAKQVILLVAGRDGLEALRNTLAAAPARAKKSLTTLARRRQAAPAKHETRDLDASR